MSVQSTLVGVIWPPGGIHVFVAGPELAPVPFVVRLNVTPPTLTVLDALIVVVPPVGDEITTVHEPVPPAVVQLDGPTKVAVAPPALVSEKLITVPSGAFTNPLPGLTFTCPVSVWFVPV